MRFKINEIGDGGLLLNVPITADWLAATCPDLEARPAPGGISLRGQLAPSGEDYLLRGEVRGALEMTCARCLEAARVQVDVPLAVTFVSGDEEEEKLGDEDPDVVVFAGREIDLADELRDEILMAIPLGPVCRPDCRGLCAVCGGNRNLTPCDCEEQRRQAESRFATLGKLKI